MRSLNGTEEDRKYHLFEEIDMQNVSYTHMEHKKEERQGWENLEEIKSEGEESEEEKEGEEETASTEVSVVPLS